MSRADLIRTANYYFTGMAPNDGKGYYPFTDDCLRHENGMITAGPKDASAPSARAARSSSRRASRAS